MLDDRKCLKKYLKSMITFSASSSILPLQPLQANFRPVFYQQNDGAKDAAAVWQPLPSLPRPSIPPPTLSLVFQSQHIIDVATEKKEKNGKKCLRLLARSLEDIFESSKGPLSPSIFPSLRSNHPPLLLVLYQSHPNLESQVLPFCNGAGGCDAENGK